MNVCGCFMLICGSDKFFVTGYPTENCRDKKFTMPAPARCCTYKTARRSLIIVNLIDFVFCIVFIGVGSVSLIYGTIL